MLSLRCDSGSELAAPMILAAGAFRHFGASLLEQANVPIGSIQRILGHEHRSTTELYLHSIGDSEREAAKGLCHYLNQFRVWSLFV